MGLWKAFISIPIIWVAETVGVLEKLEIDGVVAMIGYIGAVVGLFILGLFSNEGSQ